MMTLLKWTYVGLLVLLGAFFGLMGIAAIVQGTVQTSKSGVVAWGDFITAFVLLLATAIASRAYNETRTTDSGAAFLMTKNGSTTFRTFGLRLDVDLEGRTLTVNRSLTIPAADLHFDVKKFTKRVYFNTGGNQTVTMDGPGGTYTGSVYVPGRSGSYDHDWGAMIVLRRKGSGKRIKTLVISNIKTADAVKHALSRACAVGDV